MPPKIDWSQYDEAIVLMDFYPQLDLLQRVMEMGRAKHPENNWAELPMAEHWRALFAHLVRAGWDGTGVDDDTGQLHLSHAGCRLFFLLGKVIRGRS